MDVNDTQGNGPDEEPTVEGPQAPAGDQPTAEQPPAGGPGPKRLTGRPVGGTLDDGNSTVTGGSKWKPTPTHRSA